MYGFCRNIKLFDFVLLNLYDLAQNLRNDSVWDHTDSSKQNQVKFYVKTKTVRIVLHENNHFHLENKVKL